MSNVFNRLFGSSADFQALRKRGAIILDVRTLQEFRGGHIDGAVHIPLDQLERNMADLKQKNMPVIACCASGMRSGTAKRILTDAGIEAYNGGSWQTLAAKLR